MTQQHSGGPTRGRTRGYIVLHLPLVISSTVTEEITLVDGSYRKTFPRGTDLAAALHDWCKEAKGQPQRELLAEELARFGLSPEGTWGPLVQKKEEDP